MPRKIKRYGWIPDLPDHRDFIYAAPLAVLRALPAKKDLAAECPPVYDQGELGSCTANAIGAAHHFEQMKQNRKKAFVPSRLFIYYNERVILGTVNEDSGAMIRDGIKSVVKQGVCPEDVPGTPASEWPYVVRKFTTKPPKACYTEAMNHQVVSYRRVVQSLNHPSSPFGLRRGLRLRLRDDRRVAPERLREGGQGAHPPALPLVGSGLVPRTGEAAFGGHAVTAVGYNDGDQRFIVRNSWGSKWGKKGYCFMPYAYLTDPDLAADFWTVRMVEVPADMRA